MAVFAMMTFWAGIVSAQTTYTNPAPITINDAAPASPYPSNIVVAGSVGNITDVNVRLNGFSHTYTSDVDMLLVSPSGAKMVIMSDAGGASDVTGVTFTLDDQAAAIIGTATFPANGTSARPTNYAATDTFAAPAPAGPYAQPATAGTATLNGTFGGASANGTWSLYIVDDAGIDTGSISGGWSLIITTGGGPGTPVQHVVDFNGDGLTDWAVVRLADPANPNSQATWYIQNNGAAGGQTVPFGLASDFYVPEDYDGDGKTDIAVWRQGVAGAAAWYILQSQTNTFRGEFYGQEGDNPYVVGDYNNDGKADLAVYRLGATNNAQSFWYYRTVPQGPVFAIPWGINGPGTDDGDYPAPGDYDGDGNNDFVIQRPAGSQAQFWIRLATGAVSTVPFGIPTDLIVPGDYDGDGKTDIAVVRDVGGQINWFIRPSTGGGNYYGIHWGLSSTDFPVQGDYDGDGKTDVAVWRPSSDSTQNFFYVNRSNGSGLLAFEWGQLNDYPVANYNVH